MPVTVGANHMSVVHASSSGTAMAFPDICKTPFPPPVGPKPIPYPNIAMSSDTAMGSKQVKCDGNPICHKDSNFSTSTGDEPGSLGGIASGKTKGKAEFLNFSFDVMVEGSNVARAFDLMFHNDKNTMVFPLAQSPVAVIVIDDKIICLCCGKEF